MENQIWDNDSDKFGFSIGEDAGDFIFLIIQINQRLRNDSLILQGQGIGIIEILEKFVYFAISSKVTFFFWAIVSVSFTW